MSKALMIGVGAALLLGFLFAICIVGFALLSGMQGDVGYAPYEDVGADSMDGGYDGYDTEDTYMELLMPIIVNEKGIITPYSFFLP